MKSKKFTREETLDLAQSMRGQFIIGKALYVAVETLKKEKHPPISEIGENLFSIGYLATEVSEKFKGKDIISELTKLTQKGKKKCEEQ
jgi:hypothetical protein